MKSKFFYQGLFLFICYLSIQCENEYVNRLQYSSIGHNILQNGLVKIESTIQSMPIDQIELSKLQQDDTNPFELKYMAHGDILIPIEELENENSNINRPKRKIITETNRFGDSNRWPDGIVPYEFLSDIDNRVRQNVLNAMQHWHQRTCIRFEPYNSQRHLNIKAKIIIEDTGSGCATFVGYRATSNRLPSSYSVYLPLQCPFGSAVHELGHVIGFYHEMARIDRDLEINLYFNLMSRSERTQYDIMPEPMPGYYGQPYDLGSIMHYYPTDVMTARDSRRTFLMGQRTALSYLDVKLANLAYHCSDNCKQKPVCENEGYVDQYCKCACPDGISGYRCNILYKSIAIPELGSLTTQTFVPNSIERTTNVPASSTITERKRTTTITSRETSSTTTKPTPTSMKTEIRWLEWSDWSNCSEECGTGVRVRTRLCSDTTAVGNSDSCSLLDGSSFEIGSCQSSQCNQNDVIMSCTFDVDSEVCPLQSNSNGEIVKAMPTNEARPITDHTRGDGKYLLIVNNKTQSYNTRYIQLGPFARSKSSKEEFYCLKFWYLGRGQNAAKLRIINNRTSNNQNNYSFFFNSKGSDKNWEKIQHTFLLENEEDQLNFTFESESSDNNHMAIDDISITVGACKHEDTQSKRRRRHRQISSVDCSRVIDLTMMNKMASITSPNYPNLYPKNSVCYFYIRAPTSNRVLLQFTDFNLPTMSTNSCDDSIEIRYYHLGQTGPIYCGDGANTYNLRFTSSKNYIMLVFKSDMNYSGRGFRATATLSQ